LIIPWTIRNYVVFHKIAPIRSNGLTEVYFANCGFGTHPPGPSMEYQTLGESEFTARASRGAIDYIRTHPATFVGRFFAPGNVVLDLPNRDFWPLSLAVNIGALGALIIVFRRSSRTALPLMAVLVVYPLIYYASQVVQRRVTNRAKSAGLPTM
jgi:hypothetical protein